MQQLVSTIGKAMLALSPSDPVGRLDAVWGKYREEGDGNREEGVGRREEGRGNREQGPGLKAEAVWGDSSGA
jgi:hypothetical protein